MGKSGRSVKWLILTVIMVLMGAVEAGSAEWEVHVENEHISAYFSSYQAFELEGIVRASLPITSVTAEIIDLRVLKTEKTVRDKLNGKKAESYNLNGLKNQLELYSLKPGEKLLRVQVFSGENSAVAVEKYFYVKGWNSELVHMTKQCTITAPRGQASRLYDEKLETFCTLNGVDETITIAIPENVSAAVLTMNWYSAPTAFEIVFRGADDAVLDKVEERNPGNMINFCYDFAPAVKKIEITSFDQNNFGISELRVMEENRVSPLVQRWQPTQGKVDLMVISTHQDDELLFFGGTIPYYAAQGKNVAVVYMANCGRMRYNEALNGLWACGLRNHPIFIGWKDMSTYYQQALELWGEEQTARTLVELIRRFQPDVIVTHDVNGEYGHAQHCVTSAAVREAVRIAGDPETFPESAEEYGVWEVKKLYIHLYEENQILMTAYEQPLETMGGASALELATIAYNKHFSQVNIGRYAMETSGRIYDNRLYGLYYSAVGEDIIKEDLFENIP